MMEDLYLFNGLAIELRHPLTRDDVCVHHSLVGPFIAEQDIERQAKWSGVLATDDFRDLIKSSHQFATR
jgi:hypothetical protein